MAKYDGLIIPRAYSDYINKTDAATIQQALQLSGVLDSAPSKGNNRAVKSGGVYSTIESRISHNVPRVTPKDITTYYNDGSLWARIAGTGGYSLFEDIYVGDYFKMSRAISAYEKTGSYQVTGSDYVTIGGLEVMMNNGDSDATNFHHAVCIAGKGFSGTQHFGCATMNSDGGTEGGYKRSEMNTEVLGNVTTTASTASNATINQQLYAEFGSHLKTTRELVTSSINPTGINRFGETSGCSNSSTWISAQAILMSEVECYGSVVWSSSGYDTGNANRQLPLFVFSKQAQNNHSVSYWLKDVANYSSFCIASFDGSSDMLDANEELVFVRPRFVIA